MKKILYINLDYDKYKNKANAEIKAFSNLKMNTQVATISNENNDSYFKVLEYKNGEFSIVCSEKLDYSYEIQQGENSLFSLLKRFIKTLKLYKRFSKKILLFCNDKNYDYFYIRRIGFFIIFLNKMIKSLSKKGKIVYEIPTYPLDKYDSFLVNLSQKIEMLLFDLYIKKNIWKIAVILQNDIKLDKKMIQINNSIDPDKFSGISEKKPLFKKKFKMVIIAHILNWHGYDRLINSLKDYKGEYEVELDIYSDINNDVKKLIKLAEETGLDKNINFLGSKQLDEIFKRIGDYHVAIGSLGYHRRDGKYDTSIKNKEYCAMGLPFVCSAYDLSFPKDFEYLYKVSSDDKKFDIEEIISWYKTIKDSNYKKIMHDYAVNNLIFENSFKNIFNEE